MCLQGDDSDFLYSYASGFDLYGSIPKGKCGGVFILLYLFKKKKMSEREIPKIELFSCIIFNRRLEENKKVISGIAKV